VNKSQGFISYQSIIDWVRITINYPFRQSITLFEMNPTVRRINSNNSSQKKYKEKQTQEVIIFMEGIK
jgi:hypothetical protein